MKKYLSPYGEFEFIDDNQCVIGQTLQQFPAQPTHVFTENLTLARFRSYQAKTPELRRKSPAGMAKTIIDIHGC
ncbi:hypothetical protein [Klebsiella variicola]|uniref:hypothetical protein n=1 Tax=Klebsiella variicola TaxID=244366 RepID=UPI001889A3C4|nr:hypothetical protein [Klebsiella variicola]